jgi:pimeloyl-ACP methyl ester carboxylesterase
VLRDVGIKRRIRDRWKSEIGGVGGTAAHGSPPRLIIAGDHDECDPVLEQEMLEKLTGSQIVISPKSRPMTFVDQPEMFNDTVNTLVHLQKPTTTVATTKVD